MPRLKLRLAALALVLPLIGIGARADEPDPRTPVKLPGPMRQHLLANMRDHLAAIDQILRCLADDDPDRAAGIAETRLGVSSLARHGAHRLAPFLPAGMRRAGMRMHRAASHFALTAQEGDAAASYRALGGITAACVACHAAYRVH